MYQADAIANEFLRIADAEGVQITPMKLQKLVYYAHGWALGLKGKKLVSDRLEAWPHGPVYPSLYHEFKEFGNSAIKRRAQEYALNELGEITEVEPAIDEDDRFTKSLIHKIWKQLGQFSAVQLSNMSHSDNEPWVRVPKKRPGLAIPDDLIEACFKKMVKVEAE